ncbi:leucine-rich repeat-containing G-protein coupled receptor 4 [Biomphalaria pfeifferi]|uniref:Leucine-rich repeat-containing G-protein coupled receptor 4 n=1 Tax=Biomphalaria pfeifferi TaxID=112525 RepID=A0AAD8BTZ6_BIOPF|nr:leucine-rich repeat-containing G-protein coupled receptor 4 [Biomphalaria pfeifferi]
MAVSRENCDENFINYVAKMRFSKEMINKENMIHRKIWPNRWGYIAPIYNEMTEQLEKGKRKPLPSQVVHVDPDDFSHVWPTQDLRGFEPKDTVPPVRSSRMYGWKIGKGIVDRTDQWRQIIRLHKMFAFAKLLAKCLLISLFITVKSAEPPDCGMYRTAFPDCKCLTADDNNYKGVIDCSGLGLTSVPTPRGPIHFVIYELRLNNNSIVTLTNTSFSGFSSGIRKLDLRDNKIATVEVGCFDSLTNSLQYLFIDGNGTSDPPKIVLSKLVNLIELTMRNYGEVELSDVPEKRLFATFFNLQKLSLENWKFTSIASHAFSGPTNLIRLTLNNNPLEFLPINFLGEGNVGNLKQLTISNSNIQEISDHAFQKLTSLENLDLSHNHINKLDTNCFDNLANSLYTLNLSGNVLYNGISLQGLKNLPKLTLLDLSSNEGISSIPDLSPLGLTVNYLRLYLGNNKIQNLNSNSLASLGCHLHTLDLSSNAITSIDSNAFNSLISLVSLNLSNQNLPTNIWSVIKPLIQLEVLNLSSAELNNIPEFVFENMTNLRVLDLSSLSTSAFHNSFTSVIQPAVFAGPRASFKEFYLSGSSVSRLSPCLFHGYTSSPITMSLFGGYYLECDCYIYWMWMKIKNGSITFLPGHEPRCSSNQKLLSDLQQSDFCAELPTESCTDYYEHAAPYITLEAGTTNISVSWKIVTTTSNIKLQSIKMEIDENGMVVQSLNLSTSNTTSVFPNLKNNTQYTVCVTALYITNSTVSCKPVKTLGNIQPSTQSGDSHNINFLNPKPNISIMVGETNMVLSWKLSGSTNNLLSFIVEIKENSTFIFKDRVSLFTSTHAIADIKPSTSYITCVTAVYLTESPMKCIRLTIDRIP